MTERVAIIDLGSNSVRLIIMQIYSNSAYNLVYQQKEIVRLSEGLDPAALLQPAAMQRTINTLKLFAKRCEMFKTDKILAFATAAVRLAQNSTEFSAKVQEETGITLKVIDGVTEALFGFLGTINTIDISDALLFDLGGGSLELTLIKNRAIVSSVSLPFGSVTTTERFKLKDKISELQLQEIRSYITNEFNKIAWLKELGLPLVGIGGTIRNIAKIDQRKKNYLFPKLHNYRLGCIAFEHLWQSLHSLSLKQRQKVPGMSSDRADVIISGTTIIKCLLDITKSDRIIVSGCGLREGAFFQYYFASRQENSIVPDILEHSANNILLYHNADYEHAKHVAELAENMFEGWEQLHKLDKRDKLLLRVGALLHDIGISINYYDHSRHSAYLIENARLFGLTHREQLLCALIAGWHTGISNKYFRNKSYAEFLDEKDWDKARKLSTLLALAESLDITQSKLIKKVKAYVTKDNSACIVLVTIGNASIEKHAVLNQTRSFKKAYNASLLLEEIPL